MTTCYLFLWIRIEHIEIDSHPLLGMFSMRLIVAAAIVWVALAGNAFAANTSVQSIRDICNDAPQWLVDLDSQNPLWLSDNLVNASVNDWKGANFTEKIATVAVFLLSHEYEMGCMGSNQDARSDIGYDCKNVIDVLNREINKDYLPSNFPVWECVSQIVEFQSGQAKHYTEKNHSF